MDTLQDVDQGFSEYVECVYSDTRLIAINKSSIKTLHNSNVYVFLDRGAYGLAYKNDNNNRVLKLIEILQWDTIKIFQDEVEKQNIASYYDLAPKIYNYGLSKQIHTNIGKNFYYIEMDYLSPHIGWISSTQYDKDLRMNTCNFVNNLVDSAGLYNIEDPWAHLYYNTNTEKINMIDYGKVNYCNKNKASCKQKMLYMLGLDHFCNKIGGKRIGTKRIGTKRKKTSLTKRHKYTRRFIHKYKYSCKDKLR